MFGTTQSENLVRDGGFDWPALMRAGIRGLALKPADFWALTPAELLFMLGAGAGTAPMGRLRLEELAKAYPDHGDKMEKGEKHD